MSPSQPSGDRWPRIECILSAALEETDQLARAGGVVGYESAYRILRRAVAQVLKGSGYRSGEKAPTSGIYATDVIRQAGELYSGVVDGREVALAQGARFPPSPFPWRLLREVPCGEVSAPRA